MPTTPTETDLRLSEQIGKLAEQLTDFRVENERHFGNLERELDRRFGTLERELGGLGVESERRFGGLEREFGELKTEVRLTTRRLGWLIATLIALGVSGTGAVIWAVADISWRASAVVSQLQQHEVRIDKWTPSWMPSATGSISWSPGWTPSWMPSASSSRSWGPASNEDGPPGRSGQVRPGGFFGTEGLIDFLTAM